MKVKYKEESNSYTIKGLTRGQLQMIACLVEHIANDYDASRELQLQLEEFTGAYAPVVYAGNSVYETFKVLL